MVGLSASSLWDKLANPVLPHWGHRRFSFHSSVVMARDNKSVALVCLFGAGPALRKEGQYHHPRARAAVMSTAAAMPSAAAAISPGSSPLRVTVKVVAIIARPAI